MCLSVYNVKGLKIYKWGISVPPFPMSVPCIWYKQTSNVTLVHRVLTTRLHNKSTEQQSPCYVSGSYYKQTMDGRQVYHWAHFWHQVLANSTGDKPVLPRIREEHYASSISLLCQAFACTQFMRAPDIASKRVLAPSISLWRGTTVCQTFYSFRHHCAVPHLLSIGPMVMGYFSILCALNLTVNHRIQRAMGHANCQLTLLRHSSCPHQQCNSVSPAPTFYSATTAVASPQPWPPPAPYQYQTQSWFCCSLHSPTFHK